nr:transposase (putative), gypsy type [Tanacetum cinerariifolium]
VKHVLTQKALDSFCNKLHIPEEVHSVLPNQNDTMHERPAWKIRLYTRFFEVVNFRLPLSAFFVDKLQHFRINISQLSVIRAAKNDHFFWMDEFNCHALFPWHTAKHVTRDPAPVAADLNAQDYATIVAYPSSFQKFPKYRWSHCSAASHYPDRDDSELEASVDRLFDESCSGNQTQQGDFIKGEQDANLQLVVKVADIFVENRLLARAVLNAEVRVVATPTLPFVTAFVSTTPEREGGDHIDSMAKPTLCTNRASSFVPVMTTVTTVTSTIDPTSVTKDKLTEPFLFGAGSSSAGGTDPITGVFSDLAGSDFLVGAICTVINPDIDLQKFYVPQWSVMNRSRLDDGRICREMVDEFAPLNFYTAEVRMHAEYNVEEKRRLKSVVESQSELLKAREEEIESLKARLLLKEAKAVEAIRLRAKASNFETVEKSLRDETNALWERNIILEKERNALDVKVTELETSAMSKECFFYIFMFYLLSCMFLHDRRYMSRRLPLPDSKKESRLYADFVEMALHLEEKFYPDLLTTISGCRWLLTYGMELAIANCLKSHEYLFALEAAIGKAIEKGMQDGLADGITHDASVETVMEILRLEGPLAEKLGLNELQPHVDQLMVPIYSSLNKVVIGATALSLSLDVSISRLFYALVLTSTEGASDTVTATADITTALSTTFASASTIAPISVDDYEVMGADDQAVVDENVASFPNVDDAELNIR